MAASYPGQPRGGWSPWTASLRDTREPASAGTAGAGEAAGA